MRTEQRKKGIKLFTITIMTTGRVLSAKLDMRHGKDELVMKKNMVIFPLLLVLPNCLVFFLIFFICVQTELHIRISRLIVLQLKTLSPYMKSALLGKWLHGRPANKTKHIGIANKETSCLI